MIGLEWLEPAMDTAQHCSSPSNPLNKQTSQCNEYKYELRVTEMNTEDAVTCSTSIWGRETFSPGLDIGT